MRATSIGHAGILIETRGVSILCDPWFVPAFFGSWFPFPRNDQLSDDLLDRIERADFLYVSHLHGDHHDTPWLTSHLRRDIPILLPDYPTREQRRTLAELGFSEFVRTVDTEELEIAPGVRIAIHVESSITDGPGGDSALVVLDGESILVNQNDCRTNDLAQLRAHGPVDLHWLQFSGAIWYPMVYEMSDTLKRALCDAKVDAQFARAMRYVENVGAACGRAERRTAVFPRRRPVRIEHDRRRRDEHLPGSAGVPRAARRCGSDRRDEHPGHDDRGHARFDRGRRTRSTRPTSGRSSTTSGSTSSGTDPTGGRGSTT